MFCILPQLDILCTSAVKQHYAKNDNLPFKCHLFSAVLKFMEARKTCHRVVRTSVWSIIYSGVTGHAAEDQHLGSLDDTVFVAKLPSSSGRWDALKGVPQQLLKRAAIVFRVHKRRIELMLTYWCSQSAMIVNFEETVWSVCNLSLIHIWRCRRRG